MQSHFEEILCDYCSSHVGYTTTNSCPRPTLICDNCYENLEPEEEEEEK
jgi:hypothetical protein